MSFSHKSISCTSLVCYDCTGSTRRCRLPLSDFFFDLTLIAGKWLGIVGSAVLLGGLVIKWLAFLRDDSFSAGNVLVWCVIGLGASVFVVGAVCVLSIHWWTNRLMQFTLEHPDQAQNLANRVKQGANSTKFQATLKNDAQPPYAHLQMSPTSVGAPVAPSDFRQASVCRADSKHSTVSAHLPVIGELDCAHRPTVDQVLGALHSGSLQALNSSTGTLPDTAVENYFASASTSSKDRHAIASRHIRHSSTASANYCTVIPSTLVTSVKIAQSSSVIQFTDTFESIVIEPSIGDAHLNMDPANNCKL
jgi:hypothetical protein